jgi:hypothetical protein
MLIDILTDFKDWFVCESITQGDSTNDFNVSLDRISTPFNSGINFEDDLKAEVFSLDANNYCSEFSNLAATEQQSDISGFGGSGHPAEDAKFWHQQDGSNSCAVVAQTNIFESITGQKIPEDQACKIAQVNGWFDPEIGTRPGDVGKLLNGLGINTEQKYNATLEDIANALEKGDHVIVGLDANEIWNPLRDVKGTPIEQPNKGHAVWVTGIDTQPDGSVKMVLNDSGHLNGRMVTVDVLDFLNAWDDNGNFLVVADTPKQTILG